MKNKLVFFISLACLLFSIGGRADNLDKIDAILALPKKCHEHAFERMILESYYGYIDLNEYLIHLNRTPVFCIPKSGFDPLGLIPWVSEEMKNHKYSYPGPKSDAGSAVTSIVSAILINKFPCEP